MNIRKLKPGAFVELECRHFVAEGLGLSYFVDEAQKEKFKPHVFFIWGVLPGERFIARIAKVKSKYAHGVLAQRSDLPEDISDRAFKHELWALQAVSAVRAKPSCENYMRCGGCRMQHMSYPDTVAFKESWLRVQLAHHRVAVEQIAVDIPPEHELLHYRNHVQVHINKFGMYGFYEPFSYRTRAFPEHGCLIFNEKILRPEFPKFPVEVRAARIRQNTDNRAVFSELNSKAEIALRMQYTVAWPPGSVTQIDFPLTQFFQVNLRMLPRWLAAMESLIVPPGDRPLKVLELFSGFGFISRMLSQRLSLCTMAADLLRRDEVASVQMTSNGKVIGADYDQDYHKIDLFLPEKIPAEFLESVRQFEPDLLLINPPRAGLAKETWDVLRQSALRSFKGQIVYSSCNAATMARDLGYLSAEGYSVRGMKLFDFFPWTHHFETIALLEYKS